MFRNGLLLKPGENGAQRHARLRDQNGSFVNFEIKATVQKKVAAGEVEVWYGSESKVQKTILFVNSRFTRVSTKLAEAGYSLHLWKMDSA
jgi:hypothetical protein